MVTGWYSADMKRPKAIPVLDRLLAPLGACLTPETARRLLALKADAVVQARVDYLAGRRTEGALTPDEEAEYRNYVSYGTFVAILKSKARQFLTGSPRQ